MRTPTAAEDIKRGDRFAFGENWVRFLDTLDANRVESATRSLANMLGEQSLRGRSFVDVGCGSGLSSLAAMNLGAARVHSLDFDPQSVACAQELQRRYFPDDNRWTVEEGSALDLAYLASLGRFDCVYSWGVLHHTGDMWRTISNVCSMVAEGGRLFIAIYADQGGSSDRWRIVKRSYNRCPSGLQPAFAAIAIAPLEMRAFLRLALRGRPLRYFKSWSGHERRRGMSHWHDIVDWVGGYPFEVATPEAVFEHVHQAGFELERLTTTRGHGCHEFVFRRRSTADAAAV